LESKSLKALSTKQSKLEPLHLPRHFDLTVFERDSCIKHHIHKTDFIIPHRLYHSFGLDPDPPYEYHIAMSKESKAPTGAETTLVPWICEGCDYKVKTAIKNAPPCIYCKR
jgi:hypothetical protein